MDGSIKSLGMISCDQEDLIRSILTKQPVDLDELHKQSRVDGGFSSNDIRRLVWPKFLAVSRYTKVDFRSLAHMPGTQLRCDLDRSFHSFGHTANWSEEHFAAKKNLLSDIITALLVRNPSLEYYQGFHSVCTVVLEVCEEDPALAFNIIEYLSCHFFKDYMGSNFDNVRLILPLVLEILRMVDKKLSLFLSTANVESFFCLSWMITWFGHDINNLDKIARVYDALICSHPLFIMYMAVAMVLHARDEIFALPCEFGAVHKFLISMTEEGKELPWDKIIRNADRLMSTLPPARLKKFAGAALFDKICRKEVKLFVRPPCITRYTDSDEVLLEKFLEQEDKEAEDSRNERVELVNNDLLLAVSSAILGLFR
jgi:hypothetical protein